MKVGFAGLTVLLLLFGLLLAGCDQANAPLSDLESESILAAPSAAASWHDFSDAQRNEAILIEAQKWVGKPDGQNGNCKEWVRYVVKTASSGASFVPATDTIPGPYYQAQWILTDPYKPVSIWKAAYFSPAYFPSFLKPGQIIQLRWVNGGPHTAIIQSVSSTIMYWYDSNFSSPPDGIVRCHKFTLDDWRKKMRPGQFIRLNSPNQSKRILKSQAVSGLGLTFSCFYCSSSAIINKM